MSKDGNSGLNALKVLQQKLDPTSHLEVIHEGGYIWKAHFEFEVPAKGEDLEVIKGQLWLPLPSAYEQFLRHCNGALLYHDDRHGQWGFRLYGTKDLLIENARWKEVYEENWPLAYIAFAESLGDADLLVLDTAQPTGKGRDCRVIDGNGDDPPSL